MQADDCFVCETDLIGEVNVSEQAAQAHPEWMCDGGQMIWDLHVDKQIPFNVGYGASTPMRSSEVFEMYWHAEGMKTAYDGFVIYNGERFRVDPATCYGYADKNWGRDFTSPWVWLSSNNLVSNRTGKRLGRSAFEVGGGRPKVGPLALDRKLLGSIVHEGAAYEFNFSKPWTGIRRRISIAAKRETKSSGTSSSRPSTRFSKSTRAAPKTRCCSSTTRPPTGTGSTTASGTAGRARGASSCTARGAGASFSSTTSPRETSAANTASTTKICSAARKTARACVYNLGFIVPQGNVEGMMMVKLYDEGIFLVNGEKIFPENQAAQVEDFTGYPADKTRNAKGTIAYQILRKHNESGSMEHLKLKFDAMASHDITYVGIIQTARASGMDKFPLPYVLTCCHNSLCAVGGTINDDDHLFGLSAAKKYGGIYVPPHIAVIHQYMRENFAGCGKMILGSDSHTRYGALGTMAIGEGGGELDKQLLGDTYDIDYPGVVAIYLDGAPQPFVGPQDIALAIIGAVYKSGYVKNKVMEFVGPGVATMTTDYRNGIDVMTTETTCLSSVWRTDDDTRKYLLKHHRDDDFKYLNPADIAYYDGCVYVDLSTIKPMIALPFHPSNVYEIDELNANLEDILRETEKSAEKVAEGRASFTLLDKIADDGRLQTQQGVIAGCAGGTYTNVVEAAHALKGANIGNGEFYLSVYPSSQPVLVDLDRKGLLADLMDAGAIVRTAFCGPCFGAGDTPANNALSIRHATRNFPNREGSKPNNGQMSAVALMDARSIAATALSGGKLTSAEELDCWGDIPEYDYDDRAYRTRVYQGFGKADDTVDLRYGPNIKDWPELEPLAENILLKVSSKIRRRRHDHRRAHSLGRDLLVSVQPARPCGVHAFAARPRLCLARQGDSRPRGRAQGGLHIRRGGRRVRGHQQARGIRAPDARRSRDRLDHLRKQARRRLCTRAGGELPARARRPCKHHERIRDQALPQQLHELGYGPLPVQGQPRRVRR